MNKNLRIVLDTNVFLVSLADTFKFHWIFQAIVKKKVNLFVTTEILLEYQEVIEKRYGLNKTDATLDFLLLLPNVKLITPHYKWRMISKDQDDNKFVDCAIAGNCHLLVTNDKHFNVVKKIKFPKIEIIRAEKFTDLYKEQILTNSN